MRNQNLVVLNGRIGGDIVLKQTQAGKSFCSVNLAVAFDKKTEWFTVVFWEKNAEVLEKYAKKGSFIEITGRLTVNEWEDKEGNKKSRVEIIANWMQLLDKKEDSGDRPNHHEEQKRNGYQKQSRSDDDIPF